MSDDNNPFDDPFSGGQAADNPFASGGASGFEDDNPFASNNPFGGPPSASNTDPIPSSNGGGSRGASTRGTAARPTPSSTSSLSAYTSRAGASASAGASAFSGAGGSNSIEVAERLQELERREKQLEQQAAQLAQKEIELQRLQEQLAGARLANWPRCRPVMHHDIAGEIPRECRSMCRRMYMLWYFTCFCYVLNFLVQLTALIEKTGDTIGFFLSLAYMILAPPITLWLIYYQVYTAFRTNGGSNYVCFFCNFFLQILACILWCIGIPKVGGSGVITAIQLSQADNQAATVLCTIMILLWLILLVCSIAMIKVVHSFYRGKGGDLQRDASLLAKQGARQGAIAAM